MYIIRHIYIMNNPRYGLHKLNSQANLFSVAIKYLNACFPYLSCYFAHCCVP